MVKKRRSSFASRLNRTFETLSDKSLSLNYGFSTLDTWVGCGNFALNRLMSGRFESTFLFGRNYVLYGESGCHAIDTGILMYDGTIKKVQDIEVGEQLMGPDSKSRNVLKLCRGNEEMYKITPTKGEPFVVNKNHILSLKGGSHSRNQPVAYGTLLNMSVGDYIQQTKVFQERTKLWRTGIDFESTGRELTIPPYQLGLWLGDGSSNQPDVTTMDTEISDAWKEWTDTTGTHTVINQKENNRAWTIGARVDERQNTNDGSYNPVMVILESWNLRKNKHIPHDYLMASEEDRLQLLAGILDTDGTYGGAKPVSGKGSTFGFVQKSKQVADGVVFLARSLGFAVYPKKVIKHWKHHGKVNHGEYYSMNISGDIDRIPTRLARKQALPRKQIKQWLITGFTVEPVGNDDYYGFHLDGDHLYVMDDFTVTHNSGKSLLAGYTVAKAQQDLSATAVWFDVEKATGDLRGKRWLENLGVDTDEEVFSFVRVARLAEIKNLVSKICTQCQVDLKDGIEVDPIIIVIDSWSAGMTESQWKQAIDGESKGDMGQKAKQTGDVVTAITHLVDGLPILVLGVGHIMDDQEQYSIRKHKTTGGNKMLFMASGALLMNKKEMKIDDVESRDALDAYEDKVSNLSADLKKKVKFVGITSNVEILKSRVSKPFEKIEMQIPYATGMDKYSGLFELLQMEGTVQKAGVGWYVYNDADKKEVKFQKGKFRDHADAIMASAVYDIGDAEHDITEPETDNSTEEKPDEKES